MLGKTRRDRSNADMAWAVAWLLMILVLWLSVARPAPADPGQRAAPESVRREQIARMLVDYYQQMSTPKPFEVRTGDTWKAQQSRLRKTVLRLVGLEPLPDRIPLDVHESAPLDHPWCVVRRIAYQLWPGVYSTGLLYLPKQVAEKPAPAMLCPHGHWEHGNAHPEVQRRCFNLARLGYVTFSSTQNHYEDLHVGVSHQTLMIWNNMRALDYLESLPQVDKTRIGVAGASGGGLQTQMLVALDPRVKAATIVGLTCDFREIMFFDHCHCLCNHFPQVMRHTDHPEISTLGLPAAVQFLTMNDWTKTFKQANFPTVQQLYAANGATDRVCCEYFDTPHSYDKPKREQTYGWMERWLRGKPSTAPVPEPETTVFPAETLVNLKASVPGDKGFAEISRIYRRTRGHEVPTFTKPSDWRAYRDQKVAVLKDLLGESAALPRRAAKPDWAAVDHPKEPQLRLERRDCPSEGGILVATTVLRKTELQGKLPVVILCTAEGGAALQHVKADSPVALAKAGSLVVLPDLRFTGELGYDRSKSPAQQRLAWERNGIVWGRPVPGMACTDLRAVLDGLAKRADADMERIHVVSRGSGELAIAVLFAAAIDPRIASADVDFANCCFEKRSLPLVPFILQHGDVLQWAALMADRKLTLCNVPREAGPPEGLATVFAAVTNSGGLQIREMH